MTVLHEEAEGVHNCIATTKAGYALLQQPGKVFARALASHACTPRSWATVTAAHIAVQLPLCVWVLSPVIMRSASANQ